MLETRCLPVSSFFFVKFAFGKAQMPHVLSLRQKKSEKRTLTKLPDLLWLGVSRAAWKMEEATLEETRTETVFVTTTTTRVAEVMSQKI